MKDQLHKSVVVITGEASGDLHGAHVIEALHRRDASISICGAGGAAIRQTGATIVVDIKDLSVMGFTAVLLHAPRILKLLFRLKRLIANTNPDLLILVDFPDFNLHLAGHAKKLGVPVLYYISPTIWAWRPKRIRKIKKCVDHMAVILPFEKSIYEKHGIPVTYVGHPLLDDTDQIPAINHVNRLPAHRTIALLPGSRVEEVKRLLPPMMQAARLLQKSHPQMGFVISCASSIDESLIQEIAATCPLANLDIVAQPVSAIFTRCSLAIVASGTASLEAAIYGIPTIIVYQVAEWSYRLAKNFVHVPHIGLANLIAGKRIFPELVQEDATAENIAATARVLLTDDAAYGDMKKDIQQVQRLIGNPGASDRVATIACRLMEGKRAI